MCCSRKRSHDPNVESLVSHIDTINFTDEDKSILKKRVVGVMRKMESEQTTMEVTSGIALVFSTIISIANPFFMEILTEFPDSQSDTKNQVKWVFIALSGFSGLCLFFRNYISGKKNLTSITLETMKTEFWSFLEGVNRYKHADRGKRFKDEAGTTKQLGTFLKIWETIHSMYVRQKHKSRQRNPKTGRPEKQDGDNPILPFVNDTALFNKAYQSLSPEQRQGFEKMRAVIRGELRRTATTDAGRFYSQGPPIRKKMGQAPPDVVIKVAPKTEGETKEETTPGKSPATEDLLLGTPPVEGSVAPDDTQDILDAMIRLEAQAMPRDENEDDNRSVASSIIQ